LSSPNPNRQAKATQVTVSRRYVGARLGAAIGSPPS
jgi:hypothetical protein